MLAYVLHAWGEPPVLTEFDEPLTGGGATAVPVLAAGLNPIDLTIAAGAAPAQPTIGEVGAMMLPAVMGDEGVVEHDGRLLYTERVRSPHGTFAARTLVELTAAIPLPSGMAPEEAIPLGASGLPAWIGLRDVAQLAPGEVVIVLGATGAAGQMAVQAAKLLGASRVVAAARSADMLGRLVARGADATVVLGSGDDRVALLEATRGGADVIFDPLFGPPLVAALGATRAFGRAVTIGSKAAPSIHLPIDVLFRKSLHTLGIRTVPPALKRAAFHEMVRHHRAGDLIVDTDIVPLTRIDAAWRRQAGAPHCKLVVLPA